VVLCDGPEIVAAVAVEVAARRQEEGATER
jgi:hypothetical protein